MEKETLAVLPEEAKIAEWKRQHKTVYEVTVEDATCWLRKPTRQELSAATSLSQQDPMAFNERLLNDCWLDGDERIKTEDELFLAVCPLLAQLVEMKNASLKKI